MLLGKSIRCLFLLTYHEQKQAFHCAKPLLGVYEMGRFHEKKKKKRKEPVG